jgi:hypothetical protein
MSKRTVFFSLAQVGRVVDLDGEESRKPLRGVVTVEEIYWSDCRTMADLYLPDGAIVVDAPMRGAMVH